MQRAIVAAVAALAWLSTGFAIAAVPTPPAPAPYTPPLAPITQRAPGPTDDVAYSLGSLSSLLSTASGGSGNTWVNPLITEPAPPPAGCVTASLVLTMSGGAVASAASSTSSLATSAAQGAAGTTLTFTSTAGLYAGMAVSGTNIPAGAKIAALNSTVVTLSAATTAAVASGATFTFKAVGSCYGVSQVPSVVVAAPGTSGGVQALLHAVPDGSGGVASFVVDNAGANYTTGQTPTSAVQQASGNMAAVGHAVLSGSVVTQWVIDYPGRGYPVPPTITIAYSTHIA